jgi:hypothetical protein
MDITKKGRGAWSELIWFGIGTGGGALVNTVMDFHKRRGIS